MLHDWFGDAATEEDRAILEHSNDGAGAIVEGRTSFEKRGRRRLGNAGPAGRSLASSWRNAAVRHTRHGDLAGTHSGGDHSGGAHLNFRVLR